MKKQLFNILLFAFVALAAQAQQIERLPMDSAVRFGRLENGLTYYIRHNEMPKQRAEFHIAQAVGAILEEDDQNGLAHFLEHMCFNGTEHFQGKGIINYFESVGVNFGGNINAYTSLDQTVYRLSEVPTYRQGIIDSALLVIHDWSCAVSLLGEEIDAERGVIREEWRTGATAARRMWKESNRLMYPGSQYAKRDVIGDTAVINNFSYDALRAYYRKWYGPDLQAIIVVGDIDVDSIEAAIKTLWADVPARSNRGERPYYSVEDNAEPIVAIVQDPEAQQSRLAVLYKHEPMPKELRGTNVGYVQTVCHQLISDMLSERLSELSMRPDAPFLRGYMGYTDIMPTKDAFYNLIIAKEGQEREAFNLLLTQIEKVRRYGFTDDELDRARTNLLNKYEKAYNERTAQRNINYVHEYIAHFLDGAPFPGIEWEYECMKTMLPMFSADMINQVVAAYVQDNNIIVNFQAPLKEAVRLPSEQEVRDALRGMKDLAIEAPVQQAKDYTLVKKVPKAGKIRKVTHNTSLGTTEWLLTNGVRVILRPTQFKQDEIRLNAWSEGGLSLVETPDLPSAQLATDIIEFMGLGDLSYTDLQKALTGKTVSVEASIGSYAEAVEGESSVKDFETMLQLIYLQFTAPRRDEEAYETLRAMLRNQLANKDKNPKAIFRDSVSLMSSDYSDRVVLMNAATLDRISLDRALAVYNERFNNAADFTFTLVGNIDPDDKYTRRLICQWLGGLKTSKAREQFRDRGTRSPKGIRQNYFSYPMEIHTASNRIQFTSYDMPYTLANDLNMDMIGRILSTRYLESIREREGGSYGVGCWGGMSQLPVPRASLIMQFDTDPDKQERLMQIIYEEVKTILADGPLATDLQKEKESMLKDLQEDLEKNSWWEETLYQYYRYGINQVEEYRPAVEAITAETVRQTLQQLYDAGNNFEVVMFPDK